MFYAKRIVSPPLRAQATAPQGDPRHAHWLHLWQSERENGVVPASTIISNETSVDRCSAATGLIDHAERSLERAADTRWRTPSEIHRRAFAPGPSRSSARACKVSARRGQAGRTSAPRHLQGGDGKRATTRCRPGMRKHASAEPVCLKSNAVCPNLDHAGRRMRGLRRGVVALPSYGRSNANVPMKPEEINRSIHKLYRFTAANVAPPVKSPQS